MKDKSNKLWAAAAAALLTAAVLSTSCSVKDDRSECPCELTVRFEEPLPMSGKVCVGVFPDAGGEEAAIVRMYSQKEYEAGRSVSVARGWATVTAFCGIDNYTVNTDKHLELYPSLQSDPVYAFTQRVKVDGDTMEVVCKGHQQYAHLTIYVINGPKDSFCRFYSQVNGFDLHDMDPAEGSFHVTMYGKSSGDNRTVFECDIPRQADYSCTLTVYKHDGAIDNPYRSVPIGELMQQAGVSFKDPDQGDIEVTIDFTGGGMQVRINGWERNVSQKENF